MCGVGGGGPPRCKVFTGQGFLICLHHLRFLHFVFVASEFGCWGVVVPLCSGSLGVFHAQGFLSAGSVNSILARAKEVMTGRKGRNPASLQAAGLPSEVVL